MTDFWADCQRLKRNDPSLTRLYARSLRNGDAYAQALAECLPKCTHLESLTFEYFSVDPDRLEAILKSLQRNTSVQTFKILWGPLGDKGSIALGELLRENQTLETMWICHVEHQCDKRQVIALAKGLKDNRSLRRLSFYGNGIGDTGVEVILKALESNATLRHLDLGNNDIGAEGAKSLASFLSRNKSLRSVSIWGNSFGFEGNAIIAKSLEQNMTLHHLHFDGNAKQQRTVRLFTELNRKRGRDLLAVENVHPCLWAIMLSKVGQNNNNNTYELAPDMVFYLLREKPGLCAFPPVQQRKKRKNTEM